MKARMTRLALIALVGLASTAAPVFAQSRLQSRLPSSRLPSVEVSGVPTVRVVYGDLDTASQAGMATLSGRVNGAAAHVCRFYSGQLREASDEFQCQRTARIDAWNQFARNEELSYAEAPRLIELAAVRPSSL